MSRAIVVRPFIKRMAQAIQGTILTIKKAGLPPIMADFSMFGNGSNLNSVDRHFSNPQNMIMQLEGPVPLSFIKGPIFLGDGAFPLGEMIPYQGIPQITKSIIAGKETETQQTLAAATQNELIPGNDEAEVSEEAQVNDSEIVNAIVTSLRQNNLEIRAEEEISSGLTRIRVEDILQENRIKIPEFVMARRG